MKYLLTNKFQLKNKLLSRAAVDRCPENERKWFPLARKAVTSLAGVSEKWRKNGFHKPENQLFTSKNKLFL